jgi:hypothetical protein
MWIGLIALPAIALAEEPPLEFGLTGIVTIAQAKEYSDGGSISVYLQDEHGKTAHAGHTSPMHDDRGKFTFRAPGEKAIYHFSGIANQRALLKLLRAACLATYQTDDPQELRASRDFDRAAMADMLRKLAPSENPKPPAP